MVNSYLQKESNLKQSQLTEIFSVIKLAKYLPSNTKLELLRKLKDNLFTAPNQEQGSKSQSENPFSDSGSGVELKTDLDEA